MNEIFTKGLDVNDAWELLWPASIYVLGMAAYAVFVFKFYRFVAARDMFRLDISRYEGRSFGPARSALHVILYVFKYLVLFPVFAFFWFAILTLILAFLSKDQEFSQTLLIALATVSAIRVTSYYKEDLSRDLAKILPFAVLGIFLVDASFFKVSESFDNLKEARNDSESILYYLLFLIGLEFVLRIALGVVKLVVRIRNRLRSNPRVSEEGSPESSVAEDHSPVSTDQ